MFLCAFIVQQFQANGRIHSGKYELLISPQYGIKKKDVNQPSQVKNIF
jgi:hypothetical protein